MKNHCAYCHGKFGLVRHRRAFNSFCSRKCLDHYEAWLRAEVGKPERWLDYLWSASSLTLAKDRQFSIPRQTWRRHGTTGLSWRPISKASLDLIRMAFAASTLQLGLRRGKRRETTSETALIRRH
jgi:hypothetical protein